MKDRFEVEVPRGHYLVQRLAYKDLHDTKISVESKSTTFYGRIIECLVRPDEHVSYSWGGASLSMQEWNFPSPRGYETGDIVVVDVHKEHSNVVFLDDMDLYIVPKANIVGRLVKKG